MKFCLLVLVFAAQAAAGEIPIHLSQDTIPAETPTHVKCGVPFPRDAYHTGDPIRLVDESGETQTLQTRVTATWDKAGEQGVRWLLIDFLADPRKSYTLQFGSEASPDAPAIATETGDAITIDTGLLKGTISKTAFDPFTHMTVNGQPLAQPSAPFNGFYIEHETLGILRADLDNEASVILEENGPNRACVKADGWYVSVAGERFGRFSIRLHYTRGSGTVRVLHTFIYTGLSAEDRILDIGLQLENCPESYGGGYSQWGVEPVEDGRKWAGHARKETPRVAIVQDSFDRDHHEFKQINLDTGDVTAAGEKLGGWLRYITRPVVLTVAIKDAWQQYPFEFEFDDRIVRIHFWPKHGRAMDLSWDGYWWWLTDRQKRYMAENKPHKGDDLDAWMARLRERTNATGAAKTHELYLTWHETRRFDTADRPADAWAYARDADQPVYAYPDPAWCATTRALDHCLHTFDTTTDESRYAEAYLNLMQTAVEKRHYYGFWDYGGYHQHLLSYSPGRLQDDGGLGRWHRARPKSHYGWGTFAWLNYFRTAQRPYRDYARIYTLYAADRAMCHHTAHGRIAGAEYHYDNSEIHWMGGWHGSPGGDIPSSNLQQKDDFVFNYWLTGDRRTLDVLEMWGEQIVNTNGDNDAWLKPFLEIKHGNLNRNAGMMLHRLCMLYQATWDDRIGAMADKLADAFAEIDTMEKLRAVEVGNNGDWTWHASSGWAYDGLWQYHQLTGDERIRHTLELYCRRAAEFLSGCARGDEYRTFSALTYGYELTGDTLYLDLGKAACDRLVGQWIHSASFNPGPKHDNVVMMRFVGAMANAKDYTPRDHIDFRYADRSRPNLDPSRAHLRETVDGAWSIDVVFDSGGTFVVTRPDGEVAVRREVDRLDGSLVTLEIPADGMTGDYVLSSEGITDAVNKYLHHSFTPYACVMRKPADMKMVVRVPQQPHVQNPLRGRAFYFQAPADRDDMAVLLAPVEGEARRYTVEQIDGDWHASTDDLMLDGAGVYTISLPRDSQPRMYRLSAEVPADAYYTFVENSNGMIAFRNIPPYVSASPNEWFAPQK